MFNRFYLAMFDLMEKYRLVVYRIYQNREVGYQQIENIMLNKNSGLKYP